MPRTERSLGFFKHCFTWGNKSFEIGLIQFPHGSSALFYILFFCHSSGMYLCCFLDITKPACDTRRHYFEIAIYYYVGKKVKTPFSFQDMQNIEDIYERCYILGWYSEEPKMATRITLFVAFHVCPLTCIYFIYNIF